MQKIILLLLSLAVYASAVARSKTFGDCSDAALVAPQYAFEQWAAKCWADNNGGTTSGDVDAAMCACYNKFTTWNNCDLRSTLQYKAYLKNGCADAPTSNWTPPLATEEGTTNANKGKGVLKPVTAIPTGISQTPPCLQACAANLPNVNDLCTIAETCTDESRCLWDESYYLAALKSACKPACVESGVLSTCIAAHSSSSSPVCKILEECQPVDYDTGYSLTVASAAGTAQKCPTADVANIDAIINWRRTVCACPYGEVKSPSGQRCDPIKRISTVIEVKQDLRSIDGGESFFKTNTQLQEKIRIYIGQRIFMTAEAKAAGLFEANPINLLNLVQIKKIEGKASITTHIEQNRRLVDEEVRELVQGSAAPTWAGYNTGAGVTITYTVSVENKPVVSGLSPHNPLNDIHQNIQQYVSDIVAYKPTAVRTSSVLTSFAEGLTSLVKGSGNCGPSFNAGCAGTYAALSGVPAPGVVTSQRTSAPTAAPTFAPTQRMDYTSSPIVMFSIAGGVAVLLFAYTCFRHHNPSAPQDKKVEAPKAAPAKAATAPAKAATAPVAVLPPPAPTPAEEVQKSPVKAGRA